MQSLVHKRPLASIVAPAAKVQKTTMGQPEVVGDASGLLKGCRKCKDIEERPRIGSKRSPTAPVPRDRWAEVGRTYSQEHRKSQ